MRWVAFGLPKKEMGERVWLEFKPIQDRINEILGQLAEQYDYGSAVDSILVAPELVPRDYVKPKGYRVRKFEKLIRAAMYRLPIDRESFLNANKPDRIKFIIKNISESIQDLKTYIGADFEADRLTSDVRDALGKLQVTRTTDNE